MSVKRIFCPKCFNILTVAEGDDGKYYNKCNKCQYEQEIISDSILTVEKQIDYVDGGDLKNLNLFPIYKKVAMACPNKDCNNTEINEFVDNSKRIMLVCDKCLKKFKVKPKN